MKRCAAQSFMIALATSQSLSALAATCAFGQIPCSYDVTILPKIDCPFSEAAGSIAGFNNLGQAVLAVDCGEEEPDSYLWDGGATLEVLPKPAGITGLWATDLNDAGLIVGEMSGPLGNFGFIYDTNAAEFVAMIQSEDPEGRCRIYAINESGTVCGFRSVNDGGEPGYPQQPFVWDEKNGFTDLVGAISGGSAARDISDNGIVVGLAGNVLDALAFSYSAGELTIFPPVPNGITSSASGVNNSGQILIGGIISLTPLFGRSFLYDDGTMIELPLPPGFDGTTNAMKIRDDGLIIGSVKTLSNPNDFHGCIWVGETVTLIDDLIDPSENLEVGLAVEVINDGRILAEGFDDENDVVNVLLTPVAPLPGDSNCDRAVDVDDLLAVINAWGVCPQCQSDFDKNGVVNAADLGLVIENWTF